MKPYLLLLGLATAASFGFVDAAGKLVYLASLLAVILASVWPASEPHGFNRPHRTLDTFLLLWAFYLFASMIWSVWPQASFWFAIVVACIPLVCFAGSRHFQSPGSWVFVRRLMHLTAFFFSSWLIIEFYTRGGRSDGPLLDANAAAALINLFLLPALWVTWAPPTHRRERLKQLTLIALLAAALFSTASRGAMLALAGTFVLSVFVLMVFRIPFSRRGLIASLAAFVLGFALIHMGPQEPASRSMTHLWGDNSSQARLMLWQSTWEMYLDSPVLGSGFGTFAVLYPQFRSQQENGTEGTFAHNDYLQLLAEGGLPLLTMLLAFGVATLYWAGILISRGRQLRMKLEHYEGVGLAAAIASMFAHAGVNFIFYIAPLALWIGIYAGRLRALAITFEPPLRAPEANQLYRPARLVLGTVGMLAAGMLTTDILSYYWLSRERLSPDDYQVHSSRFEGALALSYINPINTHARDYLIRAQTKLALENQDEFIGWFMAHAALRDIEKMSEIRHASCAPRVLQASLLSAFPPPQHQSESISSEHVLIQTVQERPACLEAVMALADLYQSQGTPERALEVLEAGNRWIHLRTLDQKLRLQNLEETARTYQQLGRPDQAAIIAMLVLSNNPESISARLILDEAKSQLDTGASLQ